MRKSKRMVKKMFKEYKKQGLFSEISEDVIRPSAKECTINSRAKSTKLRWAKVQRKKMVQWEDAIIERGRVYERIFSEL